MGLEDLKGRKPTKRFNIKEKDLKAENPEIVWELELPEEALRVEHGKDYVENNNKIVIPVLEEDRLLPFTYNHMRNGKLINTYPSYSNYLNWEYTYEKGDLLQISYTIGVRVLKKSEEMYFDIIPVEKINYNLRFNTEKDTWELINDEEEFNELREELEEELKSPEVVQVTKDYYQVRDNYPKLIEKFYAEDRKKGYEKAEELFDTIYEFHYLMNLAGEIFDFQFEKIDEQITRSREKHRKAYDEFVSPTEVINPEVEKTHFISTMAEFKRIFKELLNSQKYFVKDGMVGPSIGAYYDSKQQSRDNRTPETKKTLNDFLLQRAATLNIDTIDMNEPINIKSYNDFKSQ